jgi:sugar phosphate isomerase/epimerase
LCVNPEAIARGGRAVRQLAEVEGIEIFSVHPTVVPLPKWRERSGGIEPTVQLALDAGANVVVMHTPRATSLDEGKGLAYRQGVERLQSTLVGSGLRLAVENKSVRSEAHRLYALTPLDRLRAFADRYDLGLVLDTTHAGMADEDLIQARRIFDGRLVNVHLSDMGGRVLLGNVPYMRTELGQHRFPGAGDLPLAKLLANLDANSYAGPVTLEVHPLAVRFWWPPAIRRRLAEAVRWMKRVVGDEE